MKTLLQQGISEQVNYDDLVYKFKRIIGKPAFHEQFKRLSSIIKEWHKAWINPITLYSFGFPFFKLQLRWVMPPTQ